MPTDFTTAPEVIEAQQMTGALVALADGYQVTTPEHYVGAGEDLKKVKAAAKRIEDLRVSFVAPLNATVKRINEFFAAPKARLDAAERTIKGRMVAFDAEQERIRREEQRRLDELARLERERQERAAAEARRKAQEEAERLAREAKAKREAEEAARREAEEAARAGDQARAEAARIEADRAAREAEKLAARAETKIEKAEAKAEAIEAAAAMVVAPIAQAATAKVSGISGRDDWQFRIVDKSLIPREYLTIDEKKIRGVVKALKQDARIPGVEVFKERVLASRAS